MPDSKRLEKIRTVVAHRRTDLTVVLEDIHDPHNAEAIIRTCEAFGILQIHFVFKNEKQYNPKRVGKASSSAANKWIDFRIHHSTSDCIDELKKANYKIFGAVLGQDNQSLFTVRFNTIATALLFGNERDGLSQTALESADQKITIPIIGMTQSLNVSVAAAIFIYEVVRQKGSEGNLETEDQQKLINDYSLR